MTRLRWEASGARVTRTLTGPHPYRIYHPIANGGRDGLRVSPRYVVEWTAPDGHSYVTAADYTEQGAKRAAQAHANGGPLGSEGACRRLTGRMPGEPMPPARIEGSAIAAS